MVLELQLARQQGQLSGETPEERFRSFVGGLRTPEVALALVETVDRGSDCVSPILC